MSTDSDVDDLADRIVQLCTAEAAGGQRALGGRFEDGAVATAATHLAMIAVLRAAGRAIYLDPANLGKKPPARLVATMHTAALQASFAEAVLQFLDEESRRDLLVTFSQGSLVAAAVISAARKGSSETVQ